MMVFFLFGRPFRDLQEFVPRFFSHGVLSIFCLKVVTWGGVVAHDPRDVKNFISYNLWTPKNPWKNEGF